MSYNYLSMANLPFYNVLPCGTTNFGGDIQVFTLPDTITSGPVGMNLNNLALNLIGQQQSVMNNWGFGASPVMSNPMSQMIQSMNNQLTASKINLTLSQIGSMKQALYSKLYKAGITEEDAAKIDQQIQKLNEMEQKLNQSVEDSKNGNINATELTQSLQEVESELNNMRAEEQIAQNINYTINSIDKSLERLENIINSTTITQVAKDRATEMKSKLEDLKMQLMNLQENPNNYTPQEVNNEVQRIANEYKSIASTISQISTGSTGGTTTGGTTTGGTTTGGTTTGGTTTGGTTAGGTTTGGTTTGGTTSASGIGYTPDDEELARTFYQAVDGIGTDNGKFEAVCSSLNANNVIGVMLAWQDGYNGKDKSFMEAFMGDASASQLRTCGAQIRDALKAKALSLNLYDECRADFQAINKELLKSRWENFDEGISKNYDNIIRILAQKLGHEYMSSTED